MTVLDNRQDAWLDDLQWPVDLRCGDRLAAGNVRTVAVRERVVRPGPARPAVTPLAYRGTGIGVSQVRHTPRHSVSAAATLTLACLSALITLWLGWLAHFSGGATAGSAAVPEQLAVVHVRAGETLQQLAGRMVPGVPVGQVVERIRDLNHLDSAEIGAGQTLIAPVG